MDDEKQYLEKKHWDKFLDNEFVHLENKVEQMDKKISYISGGMVILIPLVLTILGLIVTIIAR